MTHVEIELKPHGLAAIKLNGFDISNGIRGYQLNHDAAGHTPLLYLDPLIVDQGSVRGDMKVYVSPAAADLLCRLGWTPPGGAA